jgi:hypothetical protein
MPDATIALALSAVVTENDGDDDDRVLTRIDINVGTVTVFRHKTYSWYRTNQEYVDEALGAWAQVQH